MRTAQLPYLSISLLIGAIQTIGPNAPASLFGIYWYRSPYKPLAKLA